MNDYRYILAKGSKKFNCPYCGEKRFVRYVDNKAGKYLPEQYGRCDRESNCGYILSPYKDGYSQMTYELEKGSNTTVYSRKQPIAPKPIVPAKLVSFIPNDVFKGSLKGYETNHFVTFLIGLFGEDVTSGLISKYYIGTSKHWDNATVFWQIDRIGNLRTGKIMLYNPNTGKRVKEPFNHIQWVHTVLKQQDYNLKQCLFGEHLLKDKNKPVAIVESEKTAIIASVYLHQFIWVAAGSLTNLNAERCNVLRGRKVVLFPDLKAFDKWSKKANELSNITNFKVSDLLERKAFEIDKQKGYDIADVLMGL